MKRPWHIIARSTLTFARFAAAHPTRTQKRDHFTLLRGCRLGRSNLNSTWECIDETQLDERPPGHPGSPASQSISFKTSTRKPTLTRRVAHEESRTEYVSRHLWPRPLPEHGHASILPADRRAVDLRPQPRPTSGHPPPQGRPAVQPRPSPGRSPPHVPDH